jgi:hypothetical protein
MGCATHYLLKLEGVASFAVQGVICAYIVTASSQFATQQDVLGMAAQPELQELDRLKGAGRELETLQVRRRQQRR